MVLDSKGVLAKISLAGADDSLGKRRIFARCIVIGRRIRKVCSHRKEGHTRSSFVKRSVSKAFLRWYTIRNCNSNVTNPFCIPRHNTKKHQGSCFVVIGIIFGTLWWNFFLQYCFSHYGNFLVNITKKQHLSGSPRGLLLVSYNRLYWLFNRLHRCLYTSYAFIYTYNK